MTPKNTLPAAICAVLLLITPIFAHHSFSSFDMDRSLTLTGVTKRFELTNPHSYLYLEVADDKGEINEWAVEFHAVGQLLRLGFTKDSFKPGDKVTIIVHPMRDGSRLTFFSSVTLGDGRTIKFR